MARTVDGHYGNLMINNGLNRWLEVIRGKIKIEIGAGVVFQVAGEENQLIEKLDLILIHPSRFIKIFKAARIIYDR